MVGAIYRCEWSCGIRGVKLDKGHDRGIAVARIPHIFTNHLKLEYKHFVNEGCSENVRREAPFS